MTSRGAGQDGWPPSTSFSLPPSDAHLPRSSHGGIGYGPECYERGPCRPDSPPVPSNTPERRWGRTPAAGIPGRPEEKDRSTAFDEDDDAAHRCVGSNARNRGTVQR